ncbi:MAG: hypothetical protein ACI9JK_000081 [Phycisphaerales bacterium]|jgi:hypothetical protein
MGRLSVSVLHLSIYTQYGYTIEIHRKPLISRGFLFDTRHFDIGVKVFKSDTRKHGYPTGLCLQAVEIYMPPLSPNACNNVSRAPGFNASNACTICATCSVLFSNGADFAPPCACTLSFSLFSVSPTRFWSCCFESFRAH